MKRSARAVSSLLILFALATSADAQSVADFYRGKQIRVIVGTAPGDYDTWARMVARHMRQYIPGNPNFVVENMPGAGSLIAANYLYNKAAQDGTCSAQSAATFRTSRSRRSRTSISIR